MKPLRTVYKALYYVVVFLAGVLVPVLFPLRCFGREHLAGKKSFVLAVNHPTSYDGLYVILARGFGKKMLVMGKPELFQRSRLLNIFWSIAGVFPAVKGVGNREVVESVAAEVRKGRGLMIFPEGIHTQDKKLWRLKSGAFVVAQMTGVDMIPCRIGYEAGRTRLGRSTTVVFGKPITMEELGLVGEGHSGAKLREAKKVFKQRLEDLHEEYRDVLDEKGEVKHIEQGKAG